MPSTRKAPAHSQGGLSERKHGVSELDWGTGSHSFWPDTGSVFSCPLSPPPVLDSKPGRPSSHSGLHFPLASRKPGACGFCGRVSTSAHSSSPPDPAPLLSLTFCLHFPTPTPALTGILILPSFFFFSCCCCCCFKSQAEGKGKPREGIHE